MSSPASEALIAFLALLSVIAVLGLAWLVYLGRGGKPFVISIKGLGLSVDVRPNGKLERKQID